MSAVSYPPPLAPAPTLDFEPVAHAYTLAGTRVRSVTNILGKVQLTPYQHAEFERLPALEAARHRGTVVHQAIHFFNEHDLDVAGFDDAFPEFAGYLHSWMRLMATGRLHTFACEYRVASFSPRFAGTFDWLGLFDGQAALLDFATGDPETACKSLQTAAYVLAAKGWSQLPGQERLKAFLDQHQYVRRFAVQLDADGGLPKLTPYPDARDFTNFLIIAQAVNVVDALRPKLAQHPWTPDTLEQA
jgi:hypothetical protein